MRGTRREPVAIRDQASSDLDAIVELWIAAWTAGMPEIDFEARRDWFTRHLADSQAAGARMLVATIDDAIVGFVMIDPAKGYLDQIAVDPDRSEEGIGSLLLGAAKRLSPQGIDLHVNTANHPAIRFYEKNGFLVAGEATNPNSGRPVYTMHWRP